MKTTPDSAATALTSSFSHKEYYSLFDNMHVGITQKNIDRIMKNFTPTIEWREGRSLQDPLHGKDVLESYMRGYIGAIESHICKVKTVTWDPLVKVGTVVYEYEQKPIDKPLCRMFGIATFCLEADGLVSSYTAVEQKLW